MNTLRACLNKCTKKELVTIAKFYHMSGYSSLKKDDLVDMIKNHLSSEEVIFPFFSCLNQEELELCSPGKNTTDPFLARRLVNGGFCFLTEDGTYEMPTDFPTEILEKPEFITAQEKNSVLTNILNMSGMLYGCITVQAVGELYKKYTKQILKEQEIIEAIAQIPESFNDMVLVDSVYIKQDFLENDLYQMIQKCQDKLPYFMPDYKMMIHLVRYGYFNDEFTKVFADYISAHTGLSVYEVRNIVIHTQAVLRQGGTLADVGAFLRNENIISANVIDKELMAILNQMFSHSRLMLNRGFTESEKTAMQKSPIMKIYPNSPCPCGSGKKYKKCCGRR